MTRPVTPIGILAALLDDLVQDTSDPALRPRLERARDLARGLDPYLEACTTPESPALLALSRRTASVDWSHGPLEEEMLSGHVEGQLLKLLVHATRARRVLEIGMFTGYSALAMAEALPPDGVVVACELDPFAAEVAQECFAASPAGARILVEVGPALETLAKLDESFDLVFIDADKAGYAGYLAAVLDGSLLAPHGLICVDNTLLQGQAYAADASSANGRAIADFNRQVADDPRVEQVLVPVRDGLTLIRLAS